MPEPYAKRILTFEFRLGKGSFGESGQTRTTISGLRAYVQIEKAVAPSSGHAIIRIYGMTLDQMNKLSVAGTTFDGRDNQILVYAGDEKTKPSLVHHGQLWQAYPDGQAQPDVPFVAITQPAYQAALKPVPPQSFEGATDGATALEKIIKPAGWKLENSGVKVQLSNPYFPGTVWEQAKAAMKAMACFGTFDAETKTLAICPNPGKRNGTAITVSPETGMIGYPAFQQTRVIVRTLYDPSLSLETKPLRIMEVKSQFTSANGKWLIVQVDINLSSEAPNGPWEMTITGDRTTAGTAG